MTQDIVITWPQGRPLESYLRACADAAARGDDINYRIANPPAPVAAAPIPNGVDGPRRVYMVHKGYVRGWQRWLATEWRGAGTVRDPVTGDYWPAGHYLVRDPEWHPIDPIPMRGFQGWRWFDEMAARGK